MWGFYVLPHHQLKLAVLKLAVLQPSHGPGKLKFSWDVSAGIYR